MPKEETYLIKEHKGGYGLYRKFPDGNRINFNSPYKSPYGCLLHLLRFNYDFTRIDIDFEGSIDEETKSNIREFVSRISDVYNDRELLKKRIRKVNVLLTTPLCEISDIKDH